MTPYERELLDDLTEALEVSNQLIRSTFIGICRRDDMPHARKVLWSRMKANENLLTRVQEATRTGAVVAP